MSTPPEYFERTRRHASKRWEQLEGDPELAGPWHLLFKQVQSPRHIVSELLQNADDAGASEALVRIDNQSFVFEHNGEDFTEEHFASLCRFGYSNKRTLHTIGFRGIGFKCMFSLGDQVDLVTPSLSVRFHRQRFTEPAWLPTWPDTKGRTRIRVELQDEQRQREVEKNLEEWLRSPVSLLFFRSIRRVWIGEREVHWGSLGPGPVPDSEWMALYEKEDVELLLIRSQPQTFPEDALAEIREERMLGVEEEPEFPPCKIEIVLGAAGRLHVVLPTGVETELPFACNAPFIQDPARLKIKDPETSPTNRWLLERVGNLAASAMLHWLDQSATSVVERAPAYGLLPDVDREDNSLEGVCGTIVEQAFGETIAGKKLLLTEDGELVPEKRSVIFPRTLLEVWPDGLAADLLDEERRPALCQMIDTADRKKLLRWGFVEEVSKLALLDVLKRKRLPKPETWHKLLRLWAYLASEITGYSGNVSGADLKIIPVQGKDVLYGAREVVRLGEKKLLQSDNDWEFLAGYLIVLNPNWPRFLAEQRRGASGQSRCPETVELAYRVLERIGLHDTSDVDKVIGRVADEFFSQRPVALKDCIQLAQIAAKLGVSVREGFKYGTRDNHLRSRGESLLFDADGGLEELIPPDQRGVRLLHQDYLTFTACSRDDWLAWVRSGKSGLMTIPPIEQQVTTLHTSADFEQRLRGTTGYSGTPKFPYVSHRNYPCQAYFLIDHDFDQALIDYWLSLPAETEVWRTLVTLLVAANRDLWKEHVWVRGQQTRSDGQSRRSIELEARLPAAWARRLSSVPCLPDTRGILSRPDELLCRTPDTESLMDVESFVDGQLDTESNRPLLELLGVRSTPTGPDRLLDCLRTLAGTEAPPVREVEKWYHRLDQMLCSCSTDDFETIKHALQTEKLVLTHDGAWTTSSAVFRSSDEVDVPGAALVRSSVAELSLWHRIGVAERPTADCAIAWLKSIEDGAVLPADDLRRVRALLGRHAVRIWRECRHWLNLAGEWVPVNTLAYTVSMQSQIADRDLHEWVKQKTADFQHVSDELLILPPLADLPSLATQIDDRFEGPPMVSKDGVIKEWLRAFGTELARVELDSEMERDRVRCLAERLAGSMWIESTPLMIIPYLEGTPAGTPSETDVVWLDRRLYVKPLSNARLARRVPEELQKAFARPDIKAALDYAFERSAKDVMAYLQENFCLAEPVRNESDSEKTSDFDSSLTSASSGDSQEKPPDRVDDEVVETVPPTAEDAGEPVDDDGAGGSRGYGRATPDASTRWRSGQRRPSVMDRFSELKGFRREGPARFSHEDGSWIAKAIGSAFPWEHRTATGDLVRYYWPMDHCLERNPLELGADVWGLMKEHPGSYSLVLVDIEGSPVEVTGVSLLDFCAAGAITLYPASYRLVWKQCPR